MRTAAEAAPFRSSAFSAYYRLPPPLLLPRSTSSRHHSSRGEGVHGKGGSSCLRDICWKRALYRRHSHSFAPNNVKISFYLRQKCRQAPAARPGGLLHRLPMRVPFPIQFVILNNNVLLKPIKAAFNRGTRLESYLTWPKSLLHFVNFPQVFLSRSFFLCYT